MLDECDVTDSQDAQESRVVQTVAAPDDLAGEESVQVPSRVTPKRNFLDDRRKIQKIINTKTNYDDFSRFKSEGGLLGEVYPQIDQLPPHSSKKEYSELPISNAQIKEVIQAVESLEDTMKEDKKNATYLQYKVHEDGQEHLFVAEQPLRDDDEYFVEPGKMADNYFLPVNQKPLTLQSVLRPAPHNSHKPVNNMRPSTFRRPAPPEIKLRRPPTPHQKGNINMGYPLPLPSHHGSHGPQKKPPPKFNQNRLQSNMNRPPMNGVLPMKTFPPMHQNKPNYNKLGPKLNSAHQQNPTHQQNLAHQQNLPLLQFPVPPQNSGPSHFAAPPPFSVPSQFTKIPNSPVQSIIMGKPSNNVQVTVPSQTLNLGQTDIIANQVVKSQIMLPPGGNDVIAQQSSVQTYYNKPGQIILGKPMDNPMPLDQQMIPTKQLGIRTPSTPVPVLHQSTPSIHLQHENEDKHQSQNEIKSSDFIGESADKSTILPAVNTGFKPDSIVVESGFKPIIREPLMAGEDRIAEYKGNPNRREDADVEDDYEEPASFNEPNNHQYPPSDKVTETFEPMFIPSPPDHLLPTNDRTKEVFPTNHAKEDRPHPVYLKNVTNLDNVTKLVGLFSNKNTEKEVPGDLMMESDRISPHYLPPDPKLPKEHSQKLSSSSDQTFTTYDGKTVSAATLTSISDGTKGPSKLFSAKLPATFEKLLKSPQFGPFKGEIPPPVEAHINKEAEKANTAKVSDTRTTHLKLVNIKKPEDLKAEGSKKIEVAVQIPQMDEDSQEEYEDDEEDEDYKMRQRRDTKTTQFEMGEIEEVQTNGHSMPKNQVEFENEKHATAAASSMRLYWMTHLLLLALCVKLL